MAGSKKKKRMTRKRRQQQLRRRILAFLFVVAIGLAAVVCFRAPQIRERIGSVVEAIRKGKDVETESVSTLSIQTQSSVSGQSEEADAAGTSEEDSNAAEHEGSASPEPTKTPVETATPTPTPALTAAEEALLREKERQEYLAMEIENLAPVLRLQGEIPEDLIDFMEEYPETKEFVVDYLYQPEDPPSRDISKEVEKGTIPHFLQWDERWGYDYYDDSYFALAGCGPTALCEVYCGLTGKTDINPYDMGVWATERGYHIRGQGTSWDMMWSGAQELGLYVWEVDFNEGSILYNLKNGYPIICAVSPGDFTHFGHFIVLSDVDEEGNITVRDSNSKIRSERTWTVDELLWQTANMWAYNYEEN